MLTAEDNKFLTESDIGTVRSICTRALWLKNGRPEMWGEAKLVAREYEKFCWQEQGVVLDQAGESVPAAAIPAPVAHVEVASRQVAGAESTDASTIRTDHAEPPPALFRSTLQHLLHNDTARYGTRAVTIENLLCTDARGEPATRFGFNDTVTLHYLLAVHQEVDTDIIIGIRIKDTKDNFLYSVQDITRQHRLTASPGTRLYARTSFRLPLTHDKYLIKTGIFGFAEGESRPEGQYDYSRAVLWDIVEDGCVIEVALWPVMPLCGPVHANADLLVQPLPPASASNSP